MIPKIGSVFCTTLEEKNLYKKKVAILQHITLPHC